MSALEEVSTHAKRQVFASSQRRQYERVKQGVQLPASKKYLESQAVQVSVDVLVQKVQPVMFVAHSSQVNPLT